MDDWLLDSALRVFESFLAAESSLSIDFLDDLKAN